MGPERAKSSGLSGCGEDSRESGRKKSAIINGFDKLSHLERQENLSPIKDRKLEGVCPLPVK